MTIDDSSLGGAAFLPVSAGSVNATLSNMKDLALGTFVTIEGVDTAPATGLVSINLNHVMVFSMDKSAFIDKLQFESQEDDNNTDLAAIALDPVNVPSDAAEYRGIRRCTCRASSCGSPASRLFICKKIFQKC